MLLIDDFLANGAALDGLIEICRQAHAFASGLKALLDGYTDAFNDRIRLTTDLNETVKRCSVGEKIVDKQHVLTRLQESLCNDDGVVSAVRVAVNAGSILVSVQIN